MAAPAACAQFPKVGVKIRYICGKGRYVTSHNGGEKHYCFDGKHYSASTGGVPASILEYWANSERESARISEEVQRKTAHLRTSGAAQRSAVRSGTGSGAQASPSVEQSVRPAARPVPLDLIRGLEAGAGRVAVVETLGAPHGSLGNLGSEGDEESLTYLVEGGGRATIRLKQGKVSAVRLPER
jgi:hypothetical protein